MADLDPFNKALGKVLRNRRETLELTLSQAVARLTYPISTTTLSSYERGTAQVSAKRLVELAQAYQFSAPAILAAAMRGVGIEPRPLPGRQ